MKPKAIIVDIDGTLASCEHRRHFVTGKKKDWKNFNFNMVYDRVVPEVRDIVWDAWDDGISVLFVSGRSSNDRDVTSLWLFDNVFDPFWNANRAKVIDYSLLMRRSMDYRADDVVKREIYHKKIQSHYDVEFVVDDREQVIKMWEREGLFVLRVCDPGLEPVIKEISCGRIL